MGQTLGTAIGGYILAHALLSVSDQREVNADLKSSQLLGRQSPNRKMAVLVFKASLCARFGLGAGFLRLEVLCLRLSSILPASGLEQHKVQNRVLLAK
jgi:hypothetical protein